MNFIVQISSKCGQGGGGKNATILRTSLMDTPNAAAAAAAAMNMRTKAAVDRRQWPPCTARDRQKRRGLSLWRGRRRRRRRLRNLHRRYDPLYDFYGRRRGKGEAARGSIGELIIATAFRGTDVHVASLTPPS